jgi:glutaredoxin
MAEMMTLSKGRRDVPVILDDGKVTIGYGGS